MGASTNAKALTATSEVPQASSRRTAGEVRQDLVGRSFASAADVVVDDGRLVGTQTEAVLIRGISVGVPLRSVDRGRADVIV